MTTPSIKDDVELLLQTYLKTDKIERMDRSKERVALENELDETRPEMVGAVARLFTGALENLKRNADANEAIAASLAKFIKWKMG